MKIQEIYIDKYQYEVKVLVDTSCADLATINKELLELECPKELIDKANIEFGKCKDNIGMTYSNHTLKKTLIVIGKTSSKELFINTLIHEIYHYVTQLSVVHDIKDAEEKATFIGNFTMLLTDVIKDELIVQ